MFSVLENEPDFSVNEELVFDRKNSIWFDDVSQMDNYWRKKIKNSNAINCWFRHNWKYGWVLVY